MNTTFICDDSLHKQRKIGFFDRRYPVITGVPEAKDMTDEEAAALLRLALTSQPAREFLRKRAGNATS